MKFGTRQILVVEDDLLQAMDLELLLGQTGARVLGPVPTVEEGLKLVELADAAVLDIALRDHDVFPLADMLDRLKIPFVFYTGTADFTCLPARFRHVEMIRKPAQSLPHSALRALTAPPEPVEQTIEAILPKLRLAARLMYLDATASDRLVERTLVAAIEHLKAGHELGRGQDCTDWLLLRMRAIMDESGAELMN